MRFRLFVIQAMFIVGLPFCSAAVATGETLGDILRRTGWDRLIGAWVDEDSQGGALKLDYAWRFQDRVIEATSVSRERETVSLIGLNPKSGDVFNASASSDGASSLDKWSIEGEEAVLGALYLTGDGKEGTIEIRLKLVDDDTLELAIPTLEFRVKLVRSDSSDSNQ